MKYFLLVSLFLSGSVHAEESWRSAARESFLQFIKAPPADTRIELVTVTPGNTVTTAFGHTALRVVSGAEYGEHDYYLDFGQYDPSLSFLVKFLTGDARFYVGVLPMASAYQSWDASGRGMILSLLKLSPAEKQALYKKLDAAIADPGQGYEYHNYKNNCTTYISDLLAAVKGKKPSIDPKGRTTWRSRVTAYSDQIVWLRIDEILLFDYSTDLERQPYEFNFVPNDLLVTLEENDWVEARREVIKDRLYRAPADRDITRTIWFLLAAFMLLGQVNFGFLRKFEAASRRIFAVMSFLGGSQVVFVVLFTTFDFMDGTLMWLLFFPTDILLWSSLRFGGRDLRFHYGIIRAAMVLTAVALTLVYPQQIYGSALFVFLFFALYTLKARMETNAR
jgi:hypothetical protein